LAAYEGSAEAHRRAAADHDEAARFFEEHGDPDLAGRRTEAAEDRVHASEEREVVPTDQRDRIADQRDRIADERERLAAYLEERATQGDAERRLSTARREGEFAEVARRNAAMLRASGTGPLDLERLPRIGPAARTT